MLGRLAEARVVVEFAAQTKTANIWLKVRRHAMRLKIFGLLSHLAPLHARLCRFLVVTLIYLKDPNQVPLRLSLPVSSVVRPRMASPSS